MQTGLWNSCRTRGHRGARLAAMILPLPALLAPVPAQAGASIAIAICSGGGERVIAIPARENPAPRPDDQQGCTHFVCPRERGHGDPADDDEE